MSRQSLSAERLAPIHDLAEKKEADAARLFADAQHLLEERERQLQELENYREPTVEQGAARSQCAALMRNRELFRLRLAEAIRFQRMAVAEARSRVDAARNTWLAVHRQAKVYQKLIDRSVAIEARAQEQRQQKELDELALRLLRSASGPLFDS